MGIIEGATTLTSAVGNTLSSVGAATGLTGAVSAVSGALESVGSVFGANKIKTNVLHKYATYNYIIGFGIIPKDWLNDPDSTYMAGASIPLICKSASVEPNNRIKTAYGRYEFYIDNLQIECAIGLEEGNNTNVTSILFEVTEPYSMGLFVQSMQAGAQQQGYENHRTASYLLTLEFRGNRDLGIMGSSVPGTKRLIPVMIADIVSTVDHTGSKYIVKAYPYNQVALTDVHSRFKTDVSAKGKTVQEVLQLGERSLQTSINTRLKELERQKIVDVADEVIILFPKDTASAAAPTSDAATEKDAGATATPAAGGGGIYTKLGVTKGKNETYVQGEGDCNEIGSADMGFGTDRKADAPMTEDSEAYDKENKVYVMANNIADVKDADFRFEQDTSIPNAINQVIFQSKFAEQSLDPDRMTPQGYKDMWRIDVQTFIKDGGVQKGTGRDPLLIVYRVVPYQVHASKVMPPNKQSPGFEFLKQNVVREYNYLYSGKNVDIIKFQFTLQNGFASEMANDGFQQSQDVKEAAEQGSDQPKNGEKLVQPLGKGSSPQPGTFPTLISWSARKFSEDKKGGGGQESSATRAAKVFYEAITSGTDLFNVELDILGDPVYIVTGGQGNINWNKNSFYAPDGSLNWQYKETDIKLNFRTPLDINQSTGLYNFGLAGSAPLIQYSGVYTIYQVISTFSAGKFTQKLKGWRKPLQESKVTAPSSETYSSVRPPETVITEVAQAEDVTIGNDENVA